MKPKQRYRLLLAALFLIMTSCAPVLSRTYMREGVREVSFEELRKSPDLYKGQLYIFGGIIVSTKFTASGPEIEAVHVPVDKQGYFLERGRSEGRFLAYLPGDRMTLDPMVYHRGRRITLAATFVATTMGRIDEMDYEYPVFEIKQVYLWPEERYIASPAYYDPWFYPYPYFYWEPWWSFYYYSAPLPVPPRTFQRRSPQEQPVPSQPVPQPQLRKEKDFERR